MGGITMHMTKTRESDSRLTHNAGSRSTTSPPVKASAGKIRAVAFPTQTGGVPARRPFPWRKHVLMTVLVGKPPDRVPFHPIRGTFSQFEKPKRMSAGDFLYQNRHQNVFW